MEKKNKIILVVSILVILASIITSIFLLTKKDPEEPPVIEGINLPRNKDVLKDNKVNELDITNVSLITRDGISTYKATISNNTNKDITINNLYVNFHHDNDETKTLTLKETTLKSNNSTYINITSETDLSNTTKIEYIVK